MCVLSISRRGTWWGLDFFLIWVDLLRGGGRGGDMRGCIVMRGIVGTTEWVGQAAREARLFAVFLVAHFDEFGVKLCEVSKLRLNQAVMFDGVV